MPEQNPENILRRAEDLARRCVRQDRILSSSFLTPAEQSVVQGWVHRSSLECSILFQGGRLECERKLALFLPPGVKEESLSLDPYIQAVEVANHYKPLCHRDYLGAALSLGLKRETLGDIWVLEPGAFFFCTPTAAEFILQNLVQVGKSGVTVRRVSLDALPSPPGASIPVRFTVQSPRLDAIVRSLFHISRPDAVKAIASGRVMLNYMPCLRPDMEVHEKDILSFRGHGKAKISEFGGTTRRSRLSVSAELYR